MAEILQVSPEELTALEASLLNKSGDVPLHNRFRALFTLKALKNDEAVGIISKGTYHSSIFMAGVARIPLHRLISSFVS